MQQTHRIIRGNIEIDRQQYSYNRNRAENRPERIQNEIPRAYQYNHRPQQVTGAKFISVINWIHLRISTKYCNGSNQAKRHEWNLNYTFVQGRNEFRVEQIVFFLLNGAAPKDGYQICCFQNVNGCEISLQNIIFENGKKLKYQFDLWCWRMKRQKQKPSWVSVFAYLPESIQSSGCSLHWSNRLRRLPTLREAITRHIRDYYWFHIIWLIVRFTFLKLSTTHVIYVTHSSTMMRARGHRLVVCSFCSELHAVTRERSH